MPALISSKARRNAEDFELGAQFPEKRFGTGAEPTQSAIA